MATLEVTIVSPQELLFQGQANHVIVPGEAGVFEICPFHRPIVSRLLAGLIVLDDQMVPIQRGIIKVEHDAVIAIVEPDPAGGPGGGSPQQS